MISIQQAANLLILLININVLNMVDILLSKLELWFGPEETIFCTSDFLSSYIVMLPVGCLKFTTVQ